MSFSKSHALSTLKKLGKKPKSKLLPTIQVDEVNGRSHALKRVWCQGKLILSFGVKQGSKKDAGHGWIPGQLFLSERQAIAYASCQISVDDYIELLIAKGVIAADDSSPVD